MSLAIVTGTPPTTSRTITQQRGWSCTVLKKMVRDVERDLEDARTLLYSIWDEVSPSRGNTRRFIHRLRGIADSIRKEAAAAANAGNQTLAEQLLDRHDTLFDTDEFRELVLKKNTEPSAVRP